MAKLDILLAQAKARVNIKKKKKEEEELAFIKKVIASMPKPLTAEEVAAKVKIPEPKVIKEVVEVRKEVAPQEPLLSPEAIERMVEERIQRIKEEEANDNREILPEIKVIREEVDKSDLVTKADLDKWLKKINNAIVANAGGGGGWQNRIRSVDERVDELVSELTDLLKGISENTEPLTKLETLMDNLIYAMIDSKKQLVLMNTRQEEAFDTKIKEEDI